VRELRHDEIEVWLLSPMRVRERERERASERERPRARAREKGLSPAIRNSQKKNQRPVICMVHEFTVEQPFENEKHLETTIVGARTSYTAITRV
jgi:hypothetical protein